MAAWGPAAATGLLRGIRGLTENLTPAFPLACRRLPATLPPSAPFVCCRRVLGAAGTVSLASPFSLGAEKASVRLVLKKLPLCCARRTFASQTEGELRVTQILREKFPRATAIKVTDISGGCGAMYEIKIESEDFKEKRTVQQHQMVNQALKEEIKEMHGLRIFTSVPRR